ncbi:MAG TPA: hypothetical protein VEL07_16920 [Planctomycetota bacterium]|nr:hypothetical protein [Planctomycetota bacterium]
MPGSALAIGLSMASAGVHVGWHAAGRRGRAARDAYAGAAVVGALAYAPVLAIAGGRCAAWPAEVWLAVAANGALGGAYFACLARAYAGGELAPVYAVVRSLPVLLVTAWCMLRGEAAIPPIAAGLIAAGGVAIAVGPSGTRWSPIAWGVGAAAATAALSVSAALVFARLGPADAPPHVGDVLLFAACEAWAAAAAHALLLALAPAGGRRSPRVDRGTVGLGLATAASWLLAVAAVAAASDPALVVAFRQVGIPVTAAAGIVLGREPATAARIAGIAAVIAGLALAAAGSHR